ncbi:MAG: hypothetical protein OSJ69_15345 [Acetatifactor sp.]|nr:hypothetical protein [Acetatifactor sp.]
MGRWKSVIYSKKMLVFSEIVVLLLYSALVLAGYRRMERIDLTQDDMQLRTESGKTVEGAYYDTSNEDIRAVVTPPLELLKGIYYVQVSYKGQGIIQGGLIYDQARNGRELTDNDEFQVDAGQSVLTYRVKRGDTSPVRFKLRLTGDAVEGDYIQMLECHVIPAKVTCLYRIFCLTALLALLDLGIWVYLRHYRGWQAKERTIFLAAVFVTLTAGLPLFQKGLTPGADLNFHLHRIEGLYEGLMAGEFPVRIQPGWLEGHGYAVFMYGDLFLYIPAILRIVGFTLEEAYKIYLFFINAGTAAIAFYAFYRMTREKLPALVGTVVYIGSVYRLDAIYAAWTGKSAAMMFFPLVLVGFYLLFTVDVDSDEYGKIWPFLTFGFTGLLMTHMLSTLIVGFFSVIACLVMIKKVFRKKTLAVLIRSAALSAALSLWYLVPMLSYLFFGNLRVNKGLPTDAEGDYYAYLADFMQDGKNFYQLFTEERALGFVALLLILAYVISVPWQGRDSRTKQCRVLFAATLFSAWVCTVYFPVAQLSGLFGIAGKFFRMTQYQDRFLSVPAVCLAAFAAVFSTLYLSGKRDERVVWIVTGLLLCLVVRQDLEYFRTDAVAERHFADKVNLNTSGVGNGEYLPVTMDRHNLETKIRTDGSVRMEEAVRENLGYTVTVTNAGDQGTVTFPLTCYNGYQAIDVRSGTKLYTGLGDNGCVAVSVPAGYQGSFVLRFHEAWYWRAVEIASLFTLIALMIYGKKETVKKMFGKE